MKSEIQTVEEFEGDSVKLAQLAEKDAKADIKEAELVGEVTETVPAEDALLVPEEAPPVPRTHSFRGPRRPRHGQNRRGAVKTSFQANRTKQSLGRRR